MGAKLERSAFWVLVAAVFTFAFAGVGVGRAFLVLSLLLLIAHLVVARRRPHIPEVAWLGVLFIGITVLATVFSPDAARGVRRLHKFAPWLGIAVTAMLMRSPDRLATTLKAYAAGSVVLAVMTIWYTGQVVAGAIQDGATFHFPESLSYILSHVDVPYNDILGRVVTSGDMQDGQRLMAGVVLLAGLVGYAHPRRGARAAWVAALVLCTVSLVCTFKRGAWLAAGFGLALTVMLSSAPGQACMAAAAHALRRRGRAVLLVLLLAGIVCALPPTRDRIASAAVSARARVMERAKVGTRICMWFEIAPVLVRENPGGIGFKTLTSERMRQIAPHVQPRHDHLHSNIVQVLAVSGWAGLLAYLLWMGRAVTDAIVGTRHAQGCGPDAVHVSTVLAMLLSLLLLGLVEYQLGAGQIVLIYSLLIGCAAASRRRLEPTGDAGPRAA